MAHKRQNWDSNPGYGAVLYEVRWQSLFCVVCVHTLVLQKACPVNNGISQPPAIMKRLVSCQALCVA